MDELKKITVLSLEQATVAPYLTYRMAMDGIKIIRLEHPIHGDPNRNIGENILEEDRMNTYFLCINAGKKSMTINLIDSKGKKILYDLIKKLNIDIFITNQLPKNYTKLGINYEKLTSIKKDIIWVGITGFGPDSNESAYDPILQAKSGLMDLTGEPNESPQIMGVPLPDMGTSEHAYGLIMKALYKREINKKGTEINLSMFESSVSWLTVPITMTSSFDKKITRHGNTHKFFCPVSVYPTKDGYIYLAVGNDRQWKKMVSIKTFETLNQSIYAKNSGRIKNVKQINKTIKDITKEYTSEKIIKLFNQEGLPISKINSISNVITNPIIHDKLIYSTDKKTKTKITLAPPPNHTNFLKNNNNKLSFPPRFGEHNNEVLELIGYTQKEIKQLKENGII